MSNFIQNIETGKVGKFIASIPTQGQGLLHLVEDVETGFLSAFPTLERFRVAAQDLVSEVQAGVQAVADAIDTPTQSVPTGDPSAPVTSEPVPTNLAGTGVAPAQGPAPEPTADPNMPPLGA